MCIERVSLQQGLSAGTVITKKTKEPNNRVLLGVLLFGCVVSFVVCNLCLDIPTEGTVKQGLITGITEVENQNLSQVHP